MRIPSENAVSDTPGTAGPDTSSSSATDYMTCRRRPTDSFAGEGVPTASARGIHGTDPRDYKDMTVEGARRHPLQQDVTAEEDMGGMAPEGEGKVADAVKGSSRRKGSGESESGQGWHGRGRGEVTLGGEEADLERKKAQQSWAREEVKAARREGRDVDGGAGRSGRQPDTEV